MHTTANKMRIKTAPKVVRLKIFDKAVQFFYNLIQEEITYKLTCRLNFSKKFQ